MELDVFGQHCTVIIATLCNNGRRVLGMTRPPSSRTRSLRVVTLKVTAMVAMVAVKMTTTGFQHVHLEIGEFHFRSARTSCTTSVWLHLIYVLQGSLRKHVMFVIDP